MHFSVCYSSSTQCDTNGM
uniref:Uncharacterized protein n=1 Tax=Anguilla anguilla TaxID=7936 RepID=A0A0E9VRQ7_ANGAN